MSAAALVEALADAEAALDARDALAAERAAARAAAACRALGAAGATLEAGTLARARALHGRVAALAEGERARMAADIEAAGRSRRAVAAYAAPQSPRRCDPGGGALPRR